MCEQRVSALREQNHDDIRMGYALFWIKFQFINIKNQLHVAIATCRNFIQFYQEQQDWLQAATEAAKVLMVQSNTQLVDFYKRATDHVIAIPPPHDADSDSSTISVHDDTDSE